MRASEPESIQALTGSIVDDETNHFVANMANAEEIALRLGNKRERGFGDQGGRETEKPIREDAMALGVN